MTFTSCVERKGRMFMRSSYNRKRAARRYSLTILSSHFECRGNAGRVSPWYIICMARKKLSTCFPPASALRKNNSLPSSLKAADQLSARGLNEAHTPWAPCVPQRYTPLPSPRAGCAQRLSGCVSRRRRRCRISSPHQGAPGGGPRGRGIVHRALRASALVLGIPREPLSECGRALSTHGRGGRSSAAGALRGGLHVSSHGPLFQIGRKQPQDRV